MLDSSLVLSRSTYDDKLLSLLSSLPSSCLSQGETLSIVFEDCSKIILSLWQQDTQAVDKNQSLRHVATYLAHWNFSLSGRMRIDKLQVHHGLIINIATNFGPAFSCLGSAYRFALQFITHDIVPCTPLALFSQGHLRFCSSRHSSWKYRLYSYHESCLTDWLPHVAIPMIELLQCSSWFFE